MLLNFLWKSPLPLLCIPPSQRTARCRPYWYIYGPVSPAAWVGLNNQSCFSNEHLWHLPGPIKPPQPMTMAVFSMMAVPPPGMTSVIWNCFLLDSSGILFQYSQGLCRESATDEPSKPDAFFHSSSGHHWALATSQRSTSDSLGWYITYHLSPGYIQQTLLTSKVRVDVSAPGTFRLGPEWKLCRTEGTGWTITGWRLGGGPLTKENF